MTIKQQGGVFGRNPSFNDVEMNDLDANIGLFNRLGVNVTGTTARPAEFNTTVRIADGASIEWGGTTANIAGSSSSNTLFFNTNGEAGRFDSSKNLDLTYGGGNIKMASGKGIDFSATSGTGTSELFDDYEEGTWTPTLYGSGGGSATIGTVNLATYTKVGNTVHLVAYLGGIDLSAHTISGNVRLGGIPFNAVQFSGVAAATFCNMFTFDEKTTGVSAYASTNHFQLMQGSSAALITATELGTSATAVIMFSATYTAS